MGGAGHRVRVIETLRRMMALRRVAESERPQVAVGFMHSMFVPLAGPCGDGHSRRWQRTHRSGAL